MKLTSVFPICITAQVGSLSYTSIFGQTRVNKYTFNEQVTIRRRNREFNSHFDVVVRNTEANKQFNY